MQDTCDEYVFSIYAVVDNVAIMLEFSKAGA